MMNIDWKEESLRYADEIMDIREEIHQHPEPGNKEFRTARLIEEKLHEYGIPTRRLLDTAVVGYLRGTAGSSGRSRIAALRADMDALPVTEQTDWPWSSLTDGMMHACGHDVHVAAALGAAKILSKYTDCFAGEIRFIFQPDEEGDGGAQRLVRAGVMDGVDIVFGAHVAPDLPEGTIGIRYGKFYAASDVFDIMLEGKSCHGAEPENGVDALSAAAELLLSLKALPEAFLPERSVLSVGMLRGGSARNIIAGEAVLSGIIRTLGPETRKKMKDSFYETVADLADERSLNVRIRMKESYPGIVNSDRPTSYAEQKALELFGADHVVRIDRPTMTTEDFGYFISAAEGCFYHLGTGCGIPLHNERFLPPPMTPVYGAAMHASVLYGYLTAD